MTVVPLLLVAMLVVYGLSMRFIKMVVSHSPVESSSRMINQICAKITSMSAYCLECHYELLLINGASIFYIMQEEIATLCLAEPHPAHHKIYCRIVGVCQEALILVLVNEITKKGTCTCCLHYIVKILYSV
jgi:hypothetical protein